MLPNRLGQRVGVTHLLELVFHSTGVRKESTQMHKWQKPQLIIPRQVKRLLKTVALHTLQSAKQPRLEEGDLNVLMGVTQD